MSKHYVLDKDRNVVSADLLTWGFFLESPARIVGQETVGRFWISTVFLGLDHDWAMQRIIREFGEGIPLGFYAPLVFETMVFWEKPEPIVIGDKERMCRKEFHYTRRYRSWADAEAGHARALAIMKRYERMLALQEQNRK